MKHTHKGHCQICGRLQAVDSKTGLVAKHGYTVEHGFFNGTCSGSNHLPIEKSCEYLKIVFAEMKKRIVKEESRISETLAGNADKIYLRVYDGKIYKHKFIAIDKNNLPEMAEKWYKRTCGVSWEIQKKEWNKVWMKLSEDAAWYLEKNLNGLKAWIDAAEKTITTWKPAELFAVKKD